jgi:hypothetical protein
LFATLIFDDIKKSQTLSEAMRLLFAATGKFTDAPYR